MIRTTIFYLTILGLFIIGFFASVVVSQQPQQEPQNQNTQPQKTLAQSLNAFVFPAKGQTKEQQQTEEGGPT